MVKRESGASVKDNSAAVPATVSEVWARQDATGCLAWEGDASKLASPETGLKQYVRVTTGSWWWQQHPTFFFRALHFLSLPSGSPVVLLVISNEFKDKNTGSYG